MMIKNYFKMALRNLLKHKAFSLINITGLTIGLTCCLIIYQYVSFEYSFDEFNKNINQLYRVTTISSQKGDEEGQGAFTGFALAPAILNSIPEIKYAARIHPEYDGAIVSNPDVPDNVFEEQAVFYADPSILSMFTIKLLPGSSRNALAQSGMMLISRSTAKKYFGTSNPAGSILNFTGSVQNKYKIAGVFEDIPDNSHLKIDFLLPMQDLLNTETYKNEPEQGWSWNNFVTYIMLRNNTNVNDVNTKLTRVLLHYRSEKFRQNGIQAKMAAQPLSDIHLNDKIDAPAVVTGSYKTVYFFMVIAVITLLIALINYTNLTTARSLDRSKEVGVRKVIGAQRKQLILQFLCESAVTNFIAAVMAVVMSEMILPFVNDLAETKLTGLSFFDLQLMASFTAVYTLCTLLAGFYPAFMLSSFKPVSVLKGKFGSLKTQLWMRRGLVVVQFTASAVLIGGTAIVYNQLNFMRGMELGLNIEKVLVVNTPRIVPSNTEPSQASALFMQELKKLPEIKQAALSSSLPGQGFNWNGASIRRPSDDPSQTVRGVISYVDTNFFGLYKMQFLERGTYTDMTPIDDTTSLWPVIANETAIHTLGFKSPEEALNQPLNIGGYNARIAGVMKDFNWSSAHELRKNIFFSISNAGRFVSIRTSSAGLSSTIASIQNLFEELFPGNVFEYSFADQKFDEQYKDDKKFAGLFTVFAGLTIFIACLGLFGLAAFTTRQRTKEIGVRKVLGASVPEIIMLLSKDFLILVGASIIIATPVFYLLMNKWLENFAYRIKIGAGVFIITTAAVLIIAVLTVSYQAVRAALHNPVKSLRYE